MARRALSKNSIIPKKRKNTPNPVSPIPISAESKKKKEVINKLHDYMDLNFIKEIIKEMQNAYSLRGVFIFISSFTFYYRGALHDPVQNKPCLSYSGTLD